MMHANKINFFISFEKCRPHLGGFNKKKSVELQYLIFEKSNKDENEKKS